MKNLTIADMVGRTFTSVVQTDVYGSDALVFSNNDEVFTFYHSQECCELVYIEDITGDLSDLEGTPITLAAEADGEGPVISDPFNEVVQWTFYKFATIKGYVDVRWFGTSNGYYSTSVYMDYTEKTK